MNWMLRWVKKLVTVGDSFVQGYDYAMRELQYNDHRSVELREHVEIMHEIWYGKSDYFKGLQAAITEWDSK